MAIGDRPSDADLGEALQAALGEAGRPPAHEFRRRPSEYRSSFPLEELEVDLEDGSNAKLAWKRLEWSGLDDRGRIAKRRFLHDPRREAAVYALVLEPAALGAPRYYGSAVDPERDRYWLFVEWVEGRELYQVGERALWEEAARWLARMHTELAVPVGQAASGRLLDHDAAYYRRWMRRAREFARATGQPASRARAVDRLGERHGAVVEALLALPKTAIHGEFYAANVLVDTESAQPRVAPVDWELAAIGPGLTDLAALVSGRWSGEDRAAIASAYASVADASLESLDFARLQLAIQWLGWAPAAWSPPKDQRQDWLAEATALSESLGL